eukprot:scaffold250_cov110-Isochrysis_galbana.AAC.3
MLLGRQHTRTCMMLTPFESCRLTPLPSAAFTLGSGDPQGLPPLVHPQGHLPSRAAQEVQGRQHDLLLRQGHRLPGARAAAREVP